MIQLDSTAEKKFAIKLDDYDGTSNPELVQNGDFSQVGANVIQNYSFEAIGSELVSNGDFTATGTEEVTYPNFTNSDISQWKMAETGGVDRATPTWDAAEFMRLTYDIGTGAALYANFGHTLNASYKVNMRVRGTKADGVTAQGSAFNSIGDNGELGEVVTNPTLTSDWQDYEFYVVSTSTTFRFYLASAVIGDLVDFDSISVKKLGENWTLGTGWSVGEDKAISNGTNADLSQTSVLVAGAFYKITVTKSGLGVLYFDSGSFYGDAPSRLILDGANTYYLKAKVTTFSVEATTSANSSTITNISIKQLDPTDEWTLGTGASFGSGGLVINGGDGEVATQPSIPNVTKAYELTFTVANYVQGNIYGIVSDTKGDNVTSNGTHYQYLVGTSGTVTGLGCSSSFIGDVTSMFVKQIDPDDDWILTNTGGEIFITTDPSDPKGNYVSSQLGSNFKQTKFLIEKNTEYTAEFEIPSFSDGILRWYTSDGVTPLSDSYVATSAKETFNFEGNDTYGFMIQASSVGATITTATIKNISVKRRYAGEITLRFINQLTEKETVVNLTPDSHDDRCAIFTYQATDFTEGMYLIRFTGGGVTYAESLAYISKGSTPLSESEYKEYTTGDDSPDHVYIPR